MLGTMVRLVLASPPTCATKLGQNKGLGPGLVGGMGRRRDQCDPARMSLFLTSDAAYIGRGLLILQHPAAGVRPRAAGPGQGDRVFAHQWTCSGHRRARGGSKGGEDYSGEAR